MKNIDRKTVNSFGDEWSRFDQTAMSDEDSYKIFNKYFSVFSFDSLPVNAEVFDMGCGTGRWAKWVAPKVGILHCIDPSESINIAKRNLKKQNNIIFHNTSVDSSGLKNNSQDFGYSLGVLHHVPNTLEAITSCVDLLKPGAPLLLYLYYAFDNRPLWFKAIWKISDFVRKIISKLPSILKNIITDIIAIILYFPLARISATLEKLGFEVSNIPLSFYRNHTFYTMRTDARDRFGTPLEKRFTREQILEMMKSAGLTNIKFSSQSPFWCVIGYKLKNK